MKKMKKTRRTSKKEVQEDGTEREKKKM